MWIFLDILRLLVKSDKFCVKESVIFAKCVEWSQHQAREPNGESSAVCEKDCDDVKYDSNDDELNIQNKAVKPARTVNEYFNLIKHDIRFPIMNSDYFNSKVIDSKMLTNQECLDILRYMNFSSKFEQIKKKVEKAWNCNERETFVSKIKLTRDEINSMVGFLPNEYQSCKWKLLFRASEHNFSARKFHEMCDNKNPTVTIVQSKEYNNIFGGFTQAKWACTGNYRHNTSTFIFLLRRGENAKHHQNIGFRNLIIPMKWHNKYANGQNAVYHSRSYGPTFGGGFDLYLSDNCNLNKNSYSNLGHTFNAVKDNNVLAGSHNFSVEEYEVWHLE